MHFSSLQGHIKGPRALAELHKTAARFYQKGPGGHIYGDFNESKYMLATSNSATGDLFWASDVVDRSPHRGDLRNGLEPQTRNLKAIMKAFGTS